MTRVNLTVSNVCHFICIANHADRQPSAVGTQSGSFQPLAARETASHSSAGNSPTFIPSTHPGEEPELIHDVDMDGAHGNGEEKGKEADEPSQPPVRRVSLAPTPAC